MKIVTKDKGVYSFSSSHKPVERVRPGELIILETEDAVGGQIKSEDTPIESLDWSRVNKATGPIYVEGAEKGDTLVVDILDIELAEQGVILVVPGAGILGDFEFKPRAKIVKIKNYHYSTSFYAVGVVLGALTPRLTVDQFQILTQLIP